MPLELVFSRGIILMSGASAKPLEVVIQEKQFYKKIKKREERKILPHRIIIKIRDAEGIIIQDSA